MNFFLGGMVQDVQPDGGTGEFTHLHLVQYQSYREPISRIDISGDSARMERLRCLLVNCSSGALSFFCCMWHFEAKGTFPYCREPASATPPSPSIACGTRNGRICCAEPPINMGSGSRPEKDSRA